MGNPIKGTNVFGPVVPFNTDDIYASHKATYGHGGWRTVKDLNERNNIISDRREDLMIVAVEDNSFTHSTSGVAFYLLDVHHSASTSTSLMDNHNWVLLNFGYGGDGWIFPPPPQSIYQGKRGQRSFDDTYLYICVEDNLWKRVAIDWFIDSGTAGFSGGTSGLSFGDVPIWGTDGQWTYDLVVKNLESIDSTSGNLLVTFTNNTTKILEIGGDRWILPPPMSSVWVGKEGDRSYDDNYFYVCIQDNLWKRVAYDFFIFGGSTSGGGNFFSLPDGYVPIWDTTTNKWTFNLVVSKTYVDNTSGTLNVIYTNGYSTSFEINSFSSLDSLTDVTINNATSGDILTYDSNTNTWINQLFPGIIWTLPAPLTSTSTGNKGDLSYDDNFIYVCIGTNSWKRINIDYFIFSGSTSGSMPTIPIGSVPVWDGNEYASTFVVTKVEPIIQSGVYGEKITYSSGTTSFIPFGTMGAVLNGNYLPLSGGTMGGNITFLPNLGLKSNFTNFFGRPVKSGVGFKYSLFGPPSDIFIHSSSGSYLSIHNLSDNVQDIRTTDLLLNNQSYLNIMPTSIQLGNIDASMPSATITLDNNGITILSNANANTATLKTEFLTTNQIYQFPDKSGTIALLSDIINSTSGGGNFGTAGNGLSIDNSTVILGGKLDRHTNIKLSSDFPVTSSFSITDSFFGDNFNNNFGTSGLFIEHDNFFQNVELTGYQVTADNYKRGFAVSQGSILLGDLHPNYRNFPLLGKIKNGFIFESSLSLFAFYFNSQEIINIRDGILNSYDEISAPKKSINWKKRELSSTSGDVIADFKTNAIRGYWTPNNPADLIQKGYLDNKYLPLSGGTMGGSITFSEDLTINSDALASFNSIGIFKALGSGHFPSTYNNVLKSVDNSNSNIYTEQSQNSNFIYQVANYNGNISFTSFNYTAYSIKIGSKYYSFGSNGFGLNTNNGLWFGYIQSDLLTNTAVYQLPNKSGTIALTSDIIEGYLPLSGGTMGGIINFGNTLGIQSSSSVFFGRYVESSLKFNDIDYIYGPASAALKSVSSDFSTIVRVKDNNLTLSSQKIATQENTNLQLFENDASLNLNYNGTTSFVRLSSLGVMLKSSEYTNIYGSVFDTKLLTNYRNLQLPDKSGIVALLSDISGSTSGNYLPLSGGIMLGDIKLSQDKRIYYNISDTYSEYQPYNTAPTFALPWNNLRTYYIGSGDYSIPEEFTLISQNQNEIQLESRVVSGTQYAKLAIGAADLNSSLINIMVGSIGGNVKYYQFNYDGFDITTNLVGNKGTLKTDNLTTSQNYQFPDKSGVVALLSDINGESTTAGNGLSMLNKQVILGGTLNSNTIINANNYNLALNSSSGNIKINNINYPKNDGSNGYVMTTDGNGNLSLINPSPILFSQIITQTRTGNGVSSQGEVSLLSSSSGNIGTTLINANTLTIGDILKFRVRGYMNISVTGTFTFKIKLGATTLVTRNAVVISHPKTNQLFDLDFDLTVMAIGAAGKVLGNGKMMLSVGNVATPTMVELVMPITSSIDTTSNQALDFTVSWTTGFAGNLNTTTAYIKHEKI